MTRNEEVELKLELAPADVARFRALAPLGEPAREAAAQVTTYYDTPEGTLRKAGYSLRLRRRRGRTVQTVKERGGDSGGFSARAEWERRVSGGGLDFEALEETPLGKILSKKKLRGRLAVVSETRVRRTVWNLKQGKSAIELILDEGEVAAGPLAEPVCEVELELKGGRRADLFALARKLGEAVPLRMGVESKSERGFRLAGKRRRRHFKAEAVALGPEMSVAEAFAAIVQACLRHFRLNEPHVAPRDAEALHQARVAIRRLRSAFALFKPALAGDEKLRLHLRDVARALGVARDLDVVIANRRKAGSPTLVGELARLKAERRRAYDRVKETLAAPDFPTLILDIVALAEAGGWRESELGKRPVIGFADERLARQWRRLKKGGGNVAALEPEARHRLRIEAKRLRYAAEFFAGLTSKEKRRERKAFMAALEDLQEFLGALNDIETAKAVSPDLPPPGNEAALLAGSQGALDALRDAGPYWR